MKSVLVLVVASLVAASASSSFVEGLFTHDQHYKYTEIVHLLKGFETAHGTKALTTTSLSHRSAEGRDIPFLKVSGGTGSHKKRIFIEAGIHGREWMGTAAIMYFIDRLMERQNLDMDAHKLFNNFDWYFVPVANPDGYEYALTTDRTWRKNRRYMSGSECGGQVVHGVDLNRNFDADFKNAGASAVCTSEVYHGPHAFSEPETQSIRDKVAQIIRQDGPISAYISINAYGQMLATPYSYTDKLPQNHAHVTAITNAARDAIKAATGATYTVQTASTSYKASGTGTDWAYMKENIPYSLAFSVRPELGSKDGFNPPTTQIVPAGMDVWAGINAIANNL